LQIVAPLRARSHILRTRSEKPPLRRGAPNSRVTADIEWVSLRWFVGALLGGLLAACGATSVPVGSSDGRLPSLSAGSPARLLFDDEFNAASLDTRAWYTCYPWAKAGRGCSNNPSLELEWYRAANVSVSGGFLQLVAKKRQVVKGYPYTSGMVSTGGRLSTKATFAFLYGYAEARIRFPRGAGMWPAFWLVPANRTWPPEIDIMEWQGVHPRQDIVTIHWGSAKHQQQNGSAVDTGTDLYAGYHTYAVDWQPTAVVWYFDGKPIKRYTGPGIAHLPMYAILNLAIGGWEPGQLNPSPSSFPATMSVDYVRIWNRKP